MYLVDLGRVVSEATSLVDVLEATDGVWAAIYEEMAPHDGGGGDS